jgi:hypothetical protein
MGNIIDDSHDEELHGKNSYIFEDRVEGSIGHSRSDSISEEGIEEDIAEGDEEVSVEKDYYQGNVSGNDDAIHGNGVRGTNSNIVGRCRFEWQGVECDLVNDGGVFIAKGQVVACDPHEAILDDQLGADHVGLCILYYLAIVSTMMTIWKWPLVQTIFDGYSLREHLIAFNETHIPNVDDVGAIGVKKKKKFIRGSEMLLTLKVQFQELRRCC